MQLFGLLLQAGTTENAIVSENSSILNEMFIKGGYVMYPIALLLFLAIFFFIERLIFVLNKSGISKKSLRIIFGHIEKKDIKNALEICSLQHNITSKLIHEGLSMPYHSLHKIEERIEKLGQIEIAKVEKNLGVLSLIATIAPMLGFIGTILGVIKIFYNISLTDNISIGIIAGGLYEKMITSAAGLAVGIFAYICYYLVNWIIERRTLKIEANLLEFIKRLEKTLL